MIEKTMGKLINEFPFASEEELLNAFRVYLKDKYEFHAFPEEVLEYVFKVCGHSLQDLGELKKPVITAMRKYSGAIKKTENFNKEVKENSLLKNPGYFIFDFENERNLEKLNSMSAIDFIKDIKSRGFVIINIQNGK